MKEIIKDNIIGIITAIAIIGIIVETGVLIENKSKERIAIINNTKENVKKYEKCEHIEIYYYCWNEK